MPIEKRFEKRETLLSAQALTELAELGVKIQGGSGRIHVDLLYSDAAAKDVRRILKREGYAGVEPNE